MVVQIDVAQAAVMLPELLAAVGNREKVIISQGVPARRLLSVERTHVRLGILERVLSPELVPDFLEPIAAWEPGE